MGGGEETEKKKCTHTHTKTRKKTKNPTQPLRKRKWRAISGRSSRSVGGTNHMGGGESVSGRQCDPAAAAGGRR